MKNLTPENYNEVAARLNVCIDLLASRLEEDSVGNVSHYIDHGELEMAYESLILSCIKESVDCEKHTSDELRYIGIELGMEAESVFEADFWKIALEFFSRTK